MLTFFSILFLNFNFTKKIFYFLFFLTLALHVWNMWVGADPSFSQLGVVVSSSSVLDSTTSIKAFVSWLSIT